MSDGCTAMQASLVPRIAFMRLRPSMAEQPVPRLAFVAGRRDVVEIGAARALQEIAAGGRHVAQLLRGAGQQRARQHRIAPLHQRVIGEIGVAHERADAKPAACGLLDLVERKPGDVDQLGRPLDIHLHQVDQIGAAGDEFRPRAGGHLAHRIGDIAPRANTGNRS